MSSFSIQCTTCRSKLKVRDRSAIGQIVGCPKCGSMVLIEAPPAQANQSPSAKSTPVAPAAGVAASMPDTVGDSQLGASFEEAASWFDDAPSKAPAEHEPADQDLAEPSSTEPSSTEHGPVEQATSKPATTKQASIEQATDEQTAIDQEQLAPASTPQVEPAKATAAVGSVTPAATATYETPPGSPPPPAEQPESTAGALPLLPGDGWTSTATLNAKRIALVAGASVLGIMGVIGLAIFVTSADDPPQQVVENVDPATEPVDAESVDTVEEPAVAQASEASSSENEPAESIAVEEPSETVPDPLPPTPPAATPAEVVENNPPATSVELPELPVAAADTPPQVEPPTEQPTEEPPLFTDDLPNTSPPATDSGLAALDSLLPFLEGPPPAETPAQEPPQPISETQPPEPSEVASLPETKVDLPPTKPEPRKINLQARLNDPIKAIEFPNTPLIDFARLMSDFSTIPITLDPDALAQLKLTPDHELSLVMGETTVGEVLEKAVSRLNLQLERGESQLVITHNRDASGPLRQAKYSVNDLLGSDPPELDRLKRLVISNIAPGSWQEAGGSGEIEAVPGALLVRHTEPIHHQVVLFIEKMRLARGLPLRSSYDPLLFNSSQREARFEPRLQQPLSLNYFEPTRLVTIIDRVEKQTGVRMLIDWQALLAAGWSPDTQATLSVADAPLGEVLTQLLDPRGLTMRVIDSRTIQLTTPAALAQKREVEFYAVAELLKRNTWQAADLQAKLLAELPIANRSARPLLSYDTASGTLVVSASVEAQRMIEQLLQDM